MKISKFETLEHYEDVCYWWFQHDWPTLPREALPKTGFIVEGLAAGFLYKTDSTFAILEFIVGNADADKIQRRKAIDLVIKKLLNEAKDSGFKFIFSSISHPNLKKIYLKNGFKETDSNMTNYIRRFE